MYIEDELSCPLIKYHSEKIANDLIKEQEDDILFDYIVNRANYIGDIISEEIMNKVLEILDEKKINYIM